jgi:hypothetical protein
MVSWGVILMNEKHEVYLVSLVEDSIEEFSDVAVKVLFDVVLREVNYRAGLDSGKPPFGSGCAR